MMNVLVSSGRPKRYSVTVVTVVTVFRGTPSPFLYLEVTYIFIYINI